MKPVSWLLLGGSGGYLQTNVGPGTDDRYASTERVYTPAQAAGIDRQTDFIRAGGLAVIDWRDNPYGPKSGGQYYARFEVYKDQGLGQFSFRRLTAEAQHLGGPDDLRGFHAFRFYDNNSFILNGEWQ